MSRTFKSLKVALLLALMGLTAASARTASAHANLVQSIPEANARLERAPVQIELFFSEPVENDFSTIEVLDTDGNRVDNDDDAVDPEDPTRMSATVRSLPDGIYTVSWRALSSVDSHVTAGVFPIAVGNVDEAALAAAQSGATVSLSPGEAVARWFSFAAIMAVAGGMLFILAVWDPAVAQLQIGPAVNEIWRRVARFALLLLLFATVLWLLVQAGKAAGVELAFPWDASVVQVLFTTRFGALLIARLGLTFLLVRLLLVRPDHRSRRMALVLALLALLTISLGSHAAGEQEPLLAVAADWLHLVVASFWVGGLIHFVAALLAARAVASDQRTRLVARLIPRFSRVALVSVAALALTGVFASDLHLTQLSDLWTSAYGQVLSLKILLFLVMTALGAANLLYTSPTMSRAAETTGNPSPVRRFRHIVTGEAVLGLVVLLSVGLLTSLPTPADLRVEESLGGTQQAEDLKITLHISPGRVGINTFEVTVTRDGQPLDDARAVELRFTPATSGLPPSEVQLTAEGNGRYSVEGAFFSMADAYQVQTVVRRRDAFDTFANFDLSVGATASIGSSFAWHRLNGVLFVLAGLALFLAVAPLVPAPRTPRLAFAAAPALLFVLAGSLVLANNPAPAGESYPANPIPPNAASIAAGEALYQENCLPCHGATGAGEGPVGRTLNPPPADLTQHTAPGVHPDGRLYDWITNGFPDSVMPAFENRLSDEQRWHLVNYIRTLSPEAETQAE